MDDSNRIVFFAAAYNGLWNLAVKAIADLLGCLNIAFSGRLNQHSGDLIELGLPLGVVIDLALCGHP